MSKSIRLLIKRRRFVALLLIILLAVGIASSLAATQTASPEEKTASLFTLFTKANATILQAFQTLKSRNIAIPQDALNGYNQAVTLKEEAEVFRQASNWSAADGKLILALQELKHALWVIYETISSTPTQAEIELEKIASLESSISRLQEQLQQLENLARSAQAADFNTSTLDIKLGALRSWIANASQNLEQGKVDQASLDAREAKNLIDDLTQSLSNLATQLSSQRFEAYIAETQTRLTAIKQTATSSSNTVSLTAVNEAQTSLDQAKTYLASQMYNQTVTALVNSKQSEQTAVTALALKPNATTTSSTSLSNSPTAAAPP